MVRIYILPYNVAIMPSSLECGRNVVITPLYLAHLMQLHIPVAGQDAVDELLKLTRRFEEKIYQAATDLQDYLRKISLKMLSVPTMAQQQPAQPHAAQRAEQQQARQQQLIEQLRRQPPQQLLQQPPQRQQQQLLAQPLRANGSGGIQTPASGLGSNLSATAGLPRNPMTAMAGQMNPTIMNNRQQQMLQQEEVLLQQHPHRHEIDKQHSFLNLSKECMEAVERMPSRNFNNEQCDYLVDKLNVVIDSASSFLQGSRVTNRYCLPVDFARHTEIFKLLFALANQIKSFVQSCCKDAWIQAAMTLTNMADHVSSIGSNLELCKVAFGKECAGTDGLTLDQVVDFHNAEAEIIKMKASADVDTLVARVKSQLKSFRGAKRNLASYLLQRLSRVQANPGSFTSGSSLSVVNDDESFWRRLFKLVKPAERLGKGLAATVHKATWLGIPVAKETFEGHENPDFMKEVGILGKLCHPNITSLFCCAKDNRWCAIIMELMDEDLYDLMRRRCNGNSEPYPFLILEAVDIMLQIGEGVNYLHSQKIVHRDLKSFNILVETVKERGSKIEYVHAKVADFGLSKTKESSIRYSTQTFNTGTNRWMAPEVINLNMDGQESTSEPKYSFKCDVYSFAMVCYEVLTGYEPFHEERSLKRIKEKVLKGERPNLPHHCPTLLQALIQQCWIQEPKQRPSSAFICSELKYLKYLLMIGVYEIPPTSGLAQPTSTLASSSCTGPAMGQTLGQSCFSQGQLGGQLQGQMNPQQMSVLQLNPHQMGAEQLNPRQMSGEQRNPHRAATECTTDQISTDASADLAEVPQTSEEDTEHTFESTRTILPEMKDAEDQSVQDDGTTFQDAVTEMGTREDHFQTLVASGSAANVAEREEEGRGDQENGGVDFGQRRTRRDRKPLSSEHGDESQPKKLKRNNCEVNAMNPALQLVNSPRTQRSPLAI